MKMFFTAALVAGLVSIAPAATAANLQFNVNSGIVCQLVGPCTTNDQAFFDLVPTTFAGTIQADGTLLINDTIDLSFDNASQFINLAVNGGILGPESFNPPVVDGEIPSGNWLGTFDFEASNGAQGAIDLASNDGQTFFIDNFEQAFNFSLNRVVDGTSINFFISGVVELQPVPLPAALPMFVIALLSLGGMRMRTTSTTA